MGTQWEPQFFAQALLLDPALRGVSNLTVPILNWRVEQALTIH